MKNKEDILKEIFENDPLGLLNVMLKKSTVRTSDERLASSFDEINNFIEKNEREPKPDPTNISEYKLYSILKGLRDNEEKMLALEPQDKYSLLNTEKKEITSIYDIFGDDSLDILGDDSEGIFDFKHTPKDFEREKADFVARRKKCKDFDKYESIFIEVQKDLKQGKRKLLPFTETVLKAGNFYVNNGILLFLESVDFEKRKWSRGKNEQNRIRKFADGRTRTIFENGTESQLLFRSLAKVLIMNGMAVTQRNDKIVGEFIESFGGITEEDKETGHIYVLKSRSEKEDIASIDNLYKIGYSSTSVQDRIKNAENEPTYLMAPVTIESSWMCYNMNPRKFEQLIQRFFGHSCLEVDVFDKKGIRHTPREWFIVPLESIEQAITLLISGEIVSFRYDKENEVIVKK